MSVGFHLVYTGEEAIRYWLQTKVEERQLHIQNDPRGRHSVNRLNTCLPIEDT